MDSSEEIHDCCLEHARAAMERKLRRVKEAMKAQKRKLRHYKEETNDKLEELEEFVHETRIAQKYHEEMATTQQKEKTLIS